MPLGLFAQGKQYTISGTIKEAFSQKAVANVLVSVPETGFGTTTDSLGYFAIQVPRRPDYYMSIKISHQGYFSVRQQILEEHYNNAMNILLYEKVNELEEIVVSGSSAEQNLKQLQMGVNSLSIKSIQKMPTLLGEIDVIKSLFTLPGVTSVGEGATGFNVRGGAIDQNLILLDEAPIFNSAHLMGFMSVFNPDAIQRMNFYRGGVPAQYGGRTASVLHLFPKDANAEKLKISGGVGLVSSRLSIETPIVRDKMAAYISGRVSYADYLFRLTPNQSLKTTEARFYDFMGRLNYQYSEKDHFSLTAFSSADRFKIGSDSLAKTEINSTSSAFQWQPKVATLTWKHFFNPRFSLRTSAVFSRYDANISAPDSVIAFRLQSNLTYQGLKMDFSNQVYSKHFLTFGANAIRHTINPATIRPDSPASQVNTLTLPTERALELASYINDDIKLSERLTIGIGFRYAFFGQLGGSVYRYAEGKPRTQETLLDSTTYGSSTFVKTYGGLEPRISAAFSLSKNATVKANYNRMQQFVQLLSNTTAALPTDRWKIADTYTRPQIANQFALGYFQNLKENEWETSFEVFYKILQNATDYKDGANLLLEKYPETQILQGKGFAYGAEFYLKKNKGLWTGWMSYTYSDTRLKIAGNTIEETINQGKYFQPNYNRPHVFNALVNYQWRRQTSFSANMAYSTGRPVTYPSYKFKINGVTAPYFDQRNQGKIPDYIRLDLSVTIESPPDKKHWSSWNFSLYNVFARKNAYSVFFKTKDINLALYQRVNIYKLSILATIIPSLSYNFKF